MRPHCPSHYPHSTSLSNCTRVRASRLVAMHALIFQTPGGMKDLSIKQKGPFLGFSVELSVANQIRMLNSHTLLHAMSSRCPPDSRSKFIKSVLRFSSAFVCLF